MLYLHFSNRPQALAAALAAVMRADPLPLLEEETVVVPSSALARWLGFRLADALGIAMRITFDFPAIQVWRLFGRVLPDVAANTPFDPVQMRWRLLRLIVAGGPPAVQHYLQGDDGRRAWELAGRLAGLFDRYLVDRPDWIARWNAGGRCDLGPDEDWQAVLWQVLAAELVAAGGGHPRERFFAALQGEPRLRAPLPRRISLFAVEAMPDLYWQVFAQLAEYCEVHVFVLTPCREYWGDLARARERLRLEIENPAAAALLETGHPLLASLGRARRHTAVRLAEASVQAVHEYFAPASATLLGCLQGDLLELRQSSGVDVDASIELHDCHGATREAEVLHDRLLACFERLPDLHPAEILILTPDIESYAPVIEAVLTHAEPERRIPCAVADRPLAALSAWRALKRLVEVAQGTLDAESVLGLLAAQEVRDAFAIAEPEIPLLRDWVAIAGIRWGLDATARTRRGLPAEEAHTWRAGLQRLLLGVAMPDAPERLVDGTLPVPGVEGGRAELLGRFLDYCEALFELHGKVGQTPRAEGAVSGGEGMRPRQCTPSTWCAILLAALERFVAVDETGQEQRQRVHAVLLRLDETVRAARCAVPLPLAAMLAELDGLLAERAPASAFAGGTATVAALRPGRPLPARVVCLIGMNDGVWPRPAIAADFDLLAGHPRPGDFSVRDEERYAFLEAILCAGDALIVTWTGRDPRGHAEYPPAAPLAELIDTLAAMTGRLRETLIVRHPLQPFSMAYFDGSDAQLYSYDVTQCRASECLAAPRAAAPFCTSAGAPEKAELTTVDLPTLQAFFAHPAKYFLRNRLGIHLEESEELLEVDEPFVADPRLAFRLRTAHLDGLKTGATFVDTTQLLRARGSLPHGIAGELASARAEREAVGLWHAASRWAEAPTLPPIEFVFDAGMTRLAARLDGATPRGLWRLRAGKARARDWLALWLEHLVWQLAAPSAAERSSALVARDVAAVLRPIEDARALLGELLALYRQGQSAPLAFYPETAWAYAQGKSGWRDVWTGSEFGGPAGEAEDAYWRLALRDGHDDPLGDAFKSLAQRVFAPLLAARGVGDG